jgi:hypothetical protein
MGNTSDFVGHVVSLALTGFSHRSMKAATKILDQCVWLWSTAFSTQTGWHLRATELPARRPSQWCCLVTAAWRIPMLSAGDAQPGQGTDQLACVSPAMIRAMVITHVSGNPQTQMQTAWPPHAPPASRGHTESQPSPCQVPGSGSVQP